MKIKSGGGSKPLNNKGFTLIEILVTISVLVVILLLVIPTIITTMDRSKEKQYEGVINSIESAVTEYVVSNKNEFNALVNVGDKACIELSQLKEEGLIDKKLVNAKTDEEFPNDLGTLIKVDMDKKLTYQVLEGNCTTVNNIVLDIEVGVRTSSSIGVIVNTITTSAEIVGYYFSKDNGSTWTSLQTTNQYVFEGLERNTEYQIRVKAVDINEMEEEVRLTERTTNINTPTYTANPSIWTSGNITVTINYPSSKESNWVYEYQKDGGSWIQVSGTSEEVPFTANGTVIGRITDGTNIVTGSLFEVTKIDKTGPSIASVVINNRTSSSIRAVVSATDNESGIKGYYFSKDNATTWSTMQTTNTYTFTGLTKATTYPIKIKVVNNVNQETISTMINGTTTGIGVPTYTMSQNPWTNGNVVVTVTYPSSKESGWTYEYQKDGGSWTTVTGTSQAVTFSANGYIIGRVRDTGNTNNTVTASIFEAIKREPILINAEIAGGNKISRFLKTDAPILRDQIETLEIVTTNIVPTDVSVLGSYDVSEAGDGSVMLWYKQGTGSLYKVYIGGDGGVYSNSNSRYLFANLTNLTSLNIQHLNTSRATNMGSMFYIEPGNASKLTTIEFGQNFVTSNVTSMHHMFFGMSNLSSIKHSGGANNVVNFNTAKVTIMHCMFDGVSSLSTLEFGSSFVTNNVTDMQYMFSNMNSLTVIKHSGGANNVLNFNTSKVTIMGDMFRGTSSLPSLEFGSNFVTNNVVNMQYMFLDMYSLSATKGLDLRYFDFSKVTNHTLMLQNTPLTAKIIVNTNGKIWFNNNFSAWTNVVVE